MPIIYRVKSKESKESKQHFKRSIKNGKSRDKPKKDDKLKITLIIVPIALVCSAIIVFSILFTMNRKVKSESIINESYFTINTEVNTLSQYYMTSSQFHYSISNSFNDTFSLFQKAKYDI